MKPWNARQSLVALALALLAAGCAAEPTNTSSEPTPTPTVTTPSEPPTTATLTPTPSSTPTPTPTPSPTKTPARALADRLLLAAELPWFSDASSWVEGTTTPGEPSQVGPCHSFGLLSIGAVSAAHRTYVSEDGSSSTALEVVAEFPDPMTAKRAYAVIESWYLKCPRDHDGDPHIGPFTPVPLTSSGAAGWHLLTYGTTFDAQGFVQRGSRIAVVVLTLRDAQDYNYEPGHEPMVAALQRAAALL